MLADDTTIHTSGTDAPSMVATLQSCFSDIVEWTHLNYMSLYPTKTNYMILTTRQKRQILNSPPTHIITGKQQLHEVSSIGLCMCARVFEYFIFVQVLASQT